MPHALTLEQDVPSFDGKKLFVNDEELDLQRTYMVCSDRVKWES